ncbi:MAG: hypothetical protein B6D46_15975 [Polyangiaceae bacterium UTPRO1]|jgi:DNA mismatch endonuclease (patch repair protein)|nr:DNA mismatch endonuclease Vsr [Myxococcales bacterium]OQY64955.1 MAG: hypothetical protein B6D46_15975 [Polyangiaceae bacterium UTPRO1]
MSTQRRARSPSFAGLCAATPRASAAARASSRKRDTGCELLLRAALRELGLRYRVAPHDVPGRPDVVFRKERVAVFCDGDFWHGRDLEERLARLARGHNAPYWLAKIRRDVERDRRHDDRLRERGWIVLRFWEGDVRTHADHAAVKVRRAVRRRRRRRPVIP